MNEGFDPQDDIAAEVLLRDLKTIREKYCAVCGTAICGHEALMSLTLGFKSAPQCANCLASALGHSKEELRDHLSSFITHRACYNEGWLWANQEEGVEPEGLPRCLWPTDPPERSTQPKTIISGNGDGSSVLAASYDAEWDAGDMGCGDLVLELRTRLRSIPQGKVLKVLSTNPGSEEDLPSWCRMTGNPLLAAQHPVYLIQKK